MIDIRENKCRKSLIVDDEKAFGSLFGIEIDTYRSGSLFPHKIYFNNI